MYTLALMKSDRQRTLSDYRLRKFLSSKKASVIVFFGMPFYMLFNLSTGKKISLLAGVAMSAITLLPVTFA